MMMNSSKEVFFGATGFPVPVFVMDSILVDRMGREGLPIVVSMSLMNSQRILKNFTRWKGERGERVVMLSLTKDSLIIFPD